MSKSRMRPAPFKYLRIFRIAKPPYKQWLLVRDYTSDSFRDSVPRA